MSRLPEAGKALHSMTAGLIMEVTMGHYDTQVVRKMLAFTLGIQGAQLQVAKAGDPLASSVLDWDMSQCYHASARG